MTFPIAHFENKRCFWMAFNGGKLCVTDNEYIIKWLFFKIRFPKNKTKITPTPDGLIWKGFCFSIENKIWEIQFLSNVAEEFSKFIN